MATTISVTFSGLGSDWAKASRNAMTHLNYLFKQNDIGVILSAGGDKGPTITVGIDPTIQGTAVHGRTSAEADGANRLIQAKVKLPEKVTINTPRGIRNAGLGVLEFIVAHEFVHALGQIEHSSRLMTQTLGKEAGDNPAGDKLTADGVKMPPLLLATDTVETLKGIWN